MTDSAKILFLAASPNKTVRLELDIEIRTIKEKIRASPYNNKIDVVSEWAVRDDDLLFHMNNHHPNIVHFSGHGTSTGELIFEGANRASKPISNRAIKALFQNFKSYTNLVILNACHTEAQAKAIAEDIDCVIGTNQTIDDESAINFIASFYGALGFGASVKAAFEQGCTQLMLKNLPNERTPVLFTRPGIDAAHITLRELAQTSQPAQQLAPQIASKAYSREDTSAMSPRAKDRPVSIFISYAQEDKKYCAEVEKHLVTLKRRNEITVQHMNSTLGGEVEKDKLLSYLNAADIVLLLISSDFLSSNTLYENELKPTMYRRKQGLTWVIPILIRDADWKNDDLIGGLIVLPRNKKPIEVWPNRDQAFTLIVEEIRKVIARIKGSE